MAEHGVQRKLAAILAADVVGYSRLVGENEAATLGAVKSLILEVFGPAIAANNGRIFKTMGDAVFAEFASVVDAVRCAVALQRELAERGAGAREDRRIAFRMGVNLGDVVVDGEDIHGDGVNVAARLEALAEPGGICISDDAFRQLSGRLEVGFEDLGPLRLKNIEKPVRVYRVLLDAAAGRVVVAASARLRRWKWPALGAAVVLVALLAGGHFGVFPLRPQSPVPAQRMALPMPDKPSIAVLPFDNLSGDAEQDYFADGITEDLITDLSRFPGLFVIARNSSFTYKGKAVNVREVGRALGVRYVLEGSVRKAGTRVRITAQLIKAESGEHLWAERFDRELTDIFAVQDEVSRRIVSALAVSLGDAEAARATRRETDNLEAYDLVLRARQHLARFAWQDSLEAEKLLKRAMALDPNYIRAILLLAVIHRDKWGIWGEARDENLARALELGRKAAALDEGNAGAHTLLAGVYQRLLRHDDADRAAARGMALNPTHADTLYQLGQYLWIAGRQAEAIAPLEKAFRMDPYAQATYLSALGYAYANVGRFEDSVRALEMGIARRPDYVANHVFLAITYVSAGRIEEARAAAAKVLELNPDFTIGAYTGFAAFRNSADLERDVAALRKAGLPE